MEKCYLYVRKSSEDKEKQAQSIPDQIQVMTKKAESLGLNIVEVFSEEMSAKSPGRPILNEMFLKIKKGDVKNILAWKLDRLSRNPIDSGMMQHMLQIGELDTIYTNDRNYTVYDSGLMFSVESGIGNQYILDLKKNVKRGMNFKVESGVFCGCVPEGYLNNKEDKTIIKDPERFKLVRKMWDMLLTGNYTVPQLAIIVNEDWGYLTRKRGKHVGLKPISVSGLRNIFKNIFYTGDFLWKGEVKKGTHPPMITYAEFERAQKIVSGHFLDIRRSTREFAYTGFIKCGECGGQVTAFQKSKTIKATGEHITYTYYRCSKRKRGGENCSQGSIRLEDLEEQIDLYLAKIEIPSEFFDWGLAVLRNNFQKDFETKESIQRQLKSSIDLSEAKLKNLTEALITGLIEKEEFVITKNRIKIELKIHEDKLKKLKTQKNKIYSKTEELFDFVTFARKNYNNGNLEQKREILLSIGLDWVITDKKLVGEPFSRFKPIKEFIRGEELKRDRLGPTKKSISSPKTDTQNTLCSLWSGGRGLNSHTQGLKP